MWSIYFQGVALGAAMILPLGPQNMFVLTQGMRQQHYLMVATLCALSDSLLISLGVFGGSTLLNQSKLLLAGVTWGGVIFLAWYGFEALKTAFLRDITQQEQNSAPQSRWRIFVTLSAVTWLNPHVYLDTVVILGSLAGHLTENLRIGFALGAITASIVWFFSLAILAAWMAPRLRHPLVQRGIHLFIALVMWGIAGQLAWQSLSS